MSPKIRNLQMNIIGTTVSKKYENQINLLSKRKLSLTGKAIILNSIVLSKTQFLSNLFPILKYVEKTTQINFKYIWYYEKRKQSQEKHNISQKKNEE